MWNPMVASARRSQAFRMLRAMDGATLLSGLFRRAPVASSGRAVLNYNGWQGVPVRTLLSPNPEDSGVFGRSVSGVNPDTGVVQNQGLLGYTDTDKRIDPETRRSRSR